ncbi:hypothetical protein ADILRU_1020 [Leifsonia rubra CMS 76R]|nr:hypothetical protein ADILRU_1020 [Leifsonia rubra CMS 76R]
MQAEESPYPNGRAVQAAIKSAANRDERAKTIGVGDLIRQATFDRFLCRVFSVQPPKFVLKGGTGMLARLSTSRATKDIDLSVGEGDLETAVADLRQLATVDLGDHFRFELVNKVDQLDGETQPYTAGYKPTGQLETLTPANRLPLARLRTFDYALYPLVDQVADKLCATHSRYGESKSPSSRVKDLIDLLLISRKASFDARPLWIAIATESKRRDLGRIAAFIIPTDWSRRYLVLARPLGLLDDFPTASAAEERVQAMLNPILDETVTNGWWDPDAGIWMKSQ